MKFKQVYKNCVTKIVRIYIPLVLSSIFSLNSLICQAAVSPNTNTDSPQFVKEQPQAAGTLTGEAANTASKTDAKATPENLLTIDNIKVEGNRLVAAEDIMHVIKTKPGDKFNRDAVMQDLKAINGLGYFDERNLQVVPELNGSGVLLKIRVQENAPITQFAFTGNKVFDSQEINKIFTQQLGMPQNLNALSSAIDKVEQNYHEKGYVLARVTDVKNDPDGTIELSINEGEIEKVEISGNKKTKDFIIRQAIKIKPGMVYNERALTSDLRKLFANGYFQDVRRSIVPSADNPDKYVLKVEVDEKRSGSVGLGGGIDTMAGPFGSINLADNNFRGRGEILSLSSQVGTGYGGVLSNTLSNGGTGFVPNMTTYQVQANFVEPNLGGTGTNMTISGFGRDMGSFMIQQSMQQTLGASVNFSKSLGNNFTANLGLNAESTTLRDVSNLFSSQSILLNMTQRALSTGLATNGTQAWNLATSTRQTQLQGGIFATVSPSVSYDTRDSTDPTTGTLARLSASPSLGLTAASFVKFGGSVSKYVKINESTTFATNIQAGTSLGNMPQFAQYYMGGFNGLAGYRQFTDLGTGSSMLMTTAELRTRMPFLHSMDSKIAQTIDKHLKFVMFADAGQVYGNALTNSLTSRSSLGAAVGIGVRVNVPMIGVIRINYGFPLISSILGNYTPRITIGFGNGF